MGRTWPPERASGPHLALLDAPLGHTWPSWARPWPTLPWGAPGPHLALLSAPLGHLGAPLGHTWPSWARPWAAPGPPGRAPGPQPLGAPLGHTWPSWARPWATPGRAPGPHLAVL